MNYAKEVREFVISNFLYGVVAGFQDDTPFLENGIIDSTGLLELITFLETQYHVKIETGEMVPQNFDSVDRICQFLAKKLDNQAVPSTGSAYAEQDAVEELVDI